MDFPKTFPVGQDAVARAARLKRQGNLVNRLPLLRKALRYTNRIITNRLKLAEAQLQNAKYAKMDDATAADEFGYSVEKEVASIFTYKKELADPQFSAKRSLSAVAYEAQEAICSDLFKSDTDIKTFINFGGLYAYIDAVLAKKFPNIQFHASDRAEFTKLFNEFEFAGIPNLHFHAEYDIRDLFSSVDAKGGVFFHSRTATLIPSSALLDIYKAAHKAGVRYITGFEMAGLCNETLKEYEFSLEPKPSAHYRHYMYIHNYPAILRQAGYELTHFDAVQPKHSHLDLRLLCFVAKA